MQYCEIYMSQRGVSESCWKKSCTFSSSVASAKKGI